MARTKADIDAQKTAKQKLASGGTLNSTEIASVWPEGPTINQPAVFSYVDTCTLTDLDGRKVQSGQILLPSHL